MRKYYNIALIKHLIKSDRKLNKQLMKQYARGNVDANLETEYYYVNKHVIAVIKGGGKDGKQN